MKNVFFSIMVLFMLAFSMLGNMNIAEAAIQNVVVSTPSYSPQNMILGIQDLEAVTVSFTITNNRGSEIFYDVEATNPTNQAGNPLNVGAITITSQNNIDTVSFTVTKNQNTVAGTYNGIITVTELDAENGNPVDGSSEQKTYSIVVENLNPALSVTGLTNNEIVITSEEENIKTKEFTLTNSGNINLDDLTLKVEGGTFSDGTETISFRAKFGNDVFRNVILTPLTLLGYALDSFNVGSSSTVVLEANIPQDIELDNYVGRIVIADTSNAQATVTIPLTIKIEPEICSDGRVSNSVAVDGPQSGNLRISIDNPDRNDDFRINDEISIEVTVENKESKDMDVIVEAVLYDLDKNNKILTVESDSQEIEKNGEKVDFDFIMTVPNDEDIDPDNTYILYIKAFEDGDEDKYCNYDNVEIDLEREDDEVIINSFTVNPAVALQETSVSFRVEVENIGTDDQRDAYIVVKNEELSLELRSNPFDLKKYDKSGNDWIEPSLTFAIPKDAEAKDYTIEAIVYYNNGRDTASSLGTLKVQAKITAEDTQGTTPTTGTGDTQGTAPTTGAATTYIPNRSIFSNLDSTKTLFIIGDIVLVILAVLFLILIFKKK